MYIDLGENIVIAAPQPPPPPPQYPDMYIFTLWPIYKKKPLGYLFPCYRFVCYMMRSYCPEILVTLG